MNHRSRLAHLLILTAWLLATGVQWDVMQVLAWGRMFTHNAQVLPWRDALALTFSPDGMCGACHVVQDAKQDESGNAAAVALNAAKEPLVFQSPAEIVISAPVSRAWIHTEPPLIGHERARPPTPPPRPLA